MLKLELQGRARSTLGESDGLVGGIDSRWERCPRCIRISAKLDQLRCDWA
jgi:hypothetical protein